MAQLNPYTGIGNLFINTIQHPELVVVVLSLESTHSAPVAKSLDSNANLTPEQKIPIVELQDTITKLANTLQGLNFNAALVASLQQPVSLLAKHL